MNNIESYLPYLMPPLVGAFIGYLTNYIAIRMLFRPLRPWRFLGIRLPLTPGIIPAKRYELAERMGDMVGTHLLTTEDVGRALEKESFRRLLRMALAEKLGGFLDRDLGTVESLVPSDYRNRFRDLIDLLLLKAEDAVFRYLESNEFEMRLRDYLRRKGDEFLARDLESFLTPDRYEELRRHAGDRISAFLRSEELGRSVGAFIDAKAEDLLASEKPLREVLPADLVEVVLSLVRSEMPALLEKFGGMLYDPEFRERIVEKIKESIEGFLDSLAGFSGLLAGFVNMDKIYARIPEFLDQAGDEIARWLREEKTQHQIAEALRSRIEGVLNHSLGSFLDRVPYEKVAGTRRFLRNRAVEYLRSPRMADFSLVALERGVEKLKDRSFRTLLGKMLPPDSLDRLREKLADSLLEALRSREARRTFRGIVEEKVALFLYRRPLGKLSARIPGDIREEVEEILFRQLLEILKKEVPPLVETLNVRRMVEEKVNSLDILKVEGLLLSIMKEHFFYINLFGALLGFLIGTLNVFW